MRMHEEEMDRLKLLRQRLREARIEAGLTQEEVGRALGLSYAAYGNFERGRNRIGLQHLLRLSRILGKPLSFLLAIDTPLEPDEEQVLRYYRNLPNDQWENLVLLALRNFAETAIASPEAATVGHTPSVE